MLFSVLLLLTMCVSCCAEGIAILTQPVITAFVSGHNQLRSSLHLPCMVWNSTLASVAESYAYDCGIEESENFGNYYLAYPKAQKVDNVQIANAALARWSEEASYVDPEWKCISEWRCYRYSQIMWSRTTSVGCVINYCSRLDWAQVNCKYYPPGNVKGEIPY